MQSKTQISRKLQRKGNPEIARVVKVSKETKWFEGVSKLSSPRRKRIVANLSDLDKFGVDKDIIFVPGKVLSQGILTKKMKIVAFAFSESSKEKILNAGCEFKLIDDEIKSNKEMKGVKIFKK